MKTITWLYAVIIITLVTLVGGCSILSSSSDTFYPEKIKLAFSVKDDFEGFVTDTKPLAKWIEDFTGKPTEILAVDDESAAIVAVATGDATAAFLDGGAAWIGWQKLGLEVIAADQNGDGRTSYTAVAWVLADSDINAVEDLRGKVSCHTGELKSAGMLMPMGYLIAEGYIDASGVPDDVSSIKRLREQFFTNPQVGGGYKGAFQCLSEGRGEVAFVKDTTYNDYCSGEDLASWCLPKEDYKVLVEFGQVPSHPVMVSPNLDEDTKQSLLNALLALNDDPDGQAILKDILNTPGITAVSTDEHLSSYGKIITHQPGIEDHLSAKARI